MRDIIWTLIVIWLVYKVIDLFKSVSTKRSPVGSNQAHSQAHKTSHSQTTSSRKKDLNKAIEKHLNNDGEYVDFEEVK